MANRSRSPTSMDGSAPPGIPRVINNQYADHGAFVQLHSGLQPAWLSLQPGAAGASCTVGYRATSPRIRTWMSGLPHPCFPANASSSLPPVTAVPWRRFSADRTSGRSALTGASFIAVAARRLASVQQSGLQIPIVLPRARWEELISMFRRLVRPPARFVCRQPGPIPSVLDGATALPKVHHQAQTPSGIPSLLTHFDVMTS